MAVLKAHRLGWFAWVLVAAGCPAADETPSDTSQTGDTAAPAAAPRTCAEVDRNQVADPPPLEGPDITLSGTYRIDTRFIYDGGQRVTIEPGTIFLMGPDARLYFGWRNDPATVFANGREDAPILFCGTQGRTGHWQDIQLLGGTTTDSYFEWVRMEDAGGSATSDADAALVSSNALRFTDVSVVGASGTGMLLSGLAADSSDLTVTGSGGVALELYGESAVSNLPAGTYTGNAEDVALVYAISDTNVVFHDRGIPYRQMDERLVFGRADGEPSSMTFDAGVEYQFCQDCFIFMGWRSDPGTLTVNGTSDAPVVFTSSRPTPQPGDWDGISLLTGTTSDTQVEYAEFRFGGKAGSGSLIVDGGRGTVDNSTFRDSAGAGVLLDGPDDTFVLGDNNTYIDNAEGDVVSR